MKKFIYWLTGLFAVYIIAAYPNEVNKVIELITAPFNMLFNLMVKLLGYKPAVAILSYILLTLMYICLKLLYDDMVERALKKRSKRDTHGNN